MSQVSLGRPEFVPGTPPGHPTAKFLYVIFLYRFFLSTINNQKKRDVHKISARNSGAGNGCADFMGAWHFWVLSAGKPPCP